MLEIVYKTDYSYKDEENVFNTFLVINANEQI